MPSRNTSFTQYWITECCCSVAKLCLTVTPWTEAHQASLSFTISQSLLKLMSIESKMSLNYLIFCCSLLLLISIFPSIRVFSSKLALHIRWPKYWSFSFSISSSNAYWLPLGLTGLTFLSKGLSIVFSSTTVWKHQFLGTQPSLITASVQFSSIQLLSCVWVFATPWTAACRAFLSITSAWSLLKLMSIELVMPSNHLILCHCLLLLPSIFSNIRVFSKESVLCISWPKYWSFSFSISPSNDYSGMIFFRMDWLDLLAVQGTLKSLLQHHSSKALILQCTAFFIIHDYWKNHSFD